jgi:hypothetical protein
MPDLQDDGEVYRDFSPNSLSPGTQIAVSCDIRNTGSVASGPFVVHFYASTDTAISPSDHSLGTVNMGSIPASGRADCDLTGGNTGGIPAGTYYIGWLIDSTGSVAEGSEANNVAYKASYLLTVAAVSNQYTVTTLPLGMTSVATGATMLFDGSVSTYNNANAAVTLPFPVTFFGNVHTSCLVSTNGYLTFSATGNDWFNDPIPDASWPNDIIALFWDDLEVGPYGVTDQIFYRVDGTSPNRVFTVEYSSVSFGMGEGPNTFLNGQIKIYETASGNNPIELIYDTNQDWTGLWNIFSCSSGIEDGTGLSGYDGEPGSPNISTPPTASYRFQ